MKIFIVILALFSVNAHAEAFKDMVFGNAIVETITSIYDGDTFRANIKDWPPIVGVKIPVRIIGIDTPEIRSKCPKEKALAYEAKQFTVDLLSNAKVIELQNIKRGKYFRLLAIVIVDGVSLGDALIEEGLAIFYDGGTKANWCDSAL